ncbi:hypothetical protein A7U60_g3707 [Sanghuangporus baumii]|uniref:Uncharacterized protein n=1 Tax=Sanghuangporus baumii TaxID=108892 RepID=A0A9Q5HZX8_SANBA|nr:hypothetical protein A7U60_g3707 [Sanghuangporus baumii]
MTGRPRTDVHQSRSDTRSQSPNRPSIKERAAAVARTVNKHVDKNLKGESHVRVFGFGPSKEEQERMKKEEMQYHHRQRGDPRYVSRSSGEDERRRQKERAPQRHKHSSRREESRGESGNQDEQTPEYTIEEAD